VQARQPVDPPPPLWIPHSLDGYQPDARWWLYEPDGLHGIAHGARVAVWADQVAAAQQAAGVAVDRVAVRVAAVLHDCRRYDSGTDLWHGERAATWFTTHAAQLAPHLTPAQVARVAYLLAWHVPPDSACPAMTPELMALKDADGLDRVRLVDYDVHYLRTPYLVGEMIRATRLWEASAPGQPGAPGVPWARVRNAARALDLWPDG
jgi:hypothetical protein